MFSQELKAKQQVCFTEKNLEKSFFEGETSAIKINFRDILKCALLSKIVLKKAFNYQPKLTCVILEKTG